MRARSHDLISIEMKIPDSNSPIMVAAGLWLIVLAALPLVCALWFSPPGLIGLIVLEAGLSLALLVVKMRNRKLQQERRLISAMRSALERGILY